MAQSCDNSSSCRGTFRFADETRSSSGAFAATVRAPSISTFRHRLKEQRKLEKAARTAARKLLVISCASYKASDEFRSLDENQT